MSEPNNPGPETKAQTNPLEKLKKQEKGQQELEKHVKKIAEKSKNQYQHSFMKFFDHFKLEFQMKFRHMVWVSIGVFIVYQRLNQYQDLHKLKKKYFSKNIKQINQKLADNNEKTFQLQNPEGSPDTEATWVYTDMLPLEDRKEYRKGYLFFNKWMDRFNFLIPLYITAGLQFPLLASLCGLYYVQSYGYSRNQLPTIQSIYQKEKETQNQEKQQFLQNQEKQIKKESQQQQNSQEQEQEQEQEIIQEFVEKSEDQILREQLGFLKYYKHVLYMKDPVYPVGFIGVVSAIRIVSLMSQKRI